MFKPIALSLALTLPVLAMPQLAAAQAEKLAGDAYVLIGKSGNVVIVPGRDGALLIDDERETDVEEIKAAVKQVQPNGVVRYVINTHWHLDHSGGNEAFATAGATIIAHRNVRARKSTEQFMSAYNRRIPTAPATALPTVVYDTSLELHVGIETIQLRHTPRAHTDGDTLVRLEQANVLHMGDVFFNGLFPFIDRDSGGDIKGLIQSVDVGLAMADDKTKVVPAHGDITDKAGLQAYRNMLNDVATKVQAMIGKGKTIEQVREAKLTAAYKLEGNGERFVDAIYQGLTAK
ncbi:MBL fold metallo-hydrolase [Roseiterribacter gracilis]|uniref:Cyclase n=1 Tax=Roseiterribacter gracilis TaxID=2812848 RepID=A0A8S8X6K9_9PROT|nr:cyclase [Rhodospirillales bacterium TMPK1]